MVRPEYYLPHDDPPDFDSLIRTRTPALLRSAYLLTGDQHLAEDLVQASLARTHHAWRRLRDTGNAEAYTRKVMYHLQASWWRRRRVPEWATGQVPEPRDGGRDPADAVDLRVSLQRALMRLTLRQRAVLVLRYFEDLSEVQTAEILGVSVGTIKSQTSKALARLRQIAPNLASLDVRDEERTT